MKSLRGTEPFLTLGQGLFLVAVFYAPFAYGCTTELTWAGLDALLLAGTLCWLAGRLLSRQPFRVPRTALLLAGLLAVLGLAQWANPRFMLEPVGQMLRPLATAPEGTPWKPFTMDRGTTASALIHLAILGGAFFALSDLMANRKRRWNMLGGIAVAGLVVSLFGLALKAANQLVVPGTETRSGTFFAMYVYHGHAAAFLNLCWPAAAAFAVRSLHAGGTAAGRSLWLNAWFFIVVALLVNISKFGHLSVIPGLGLALLLFWKGRPPDWNPSPLIVAASLGVLGFMLVVLALPAVTIGLERWDHLLRDGGAGRTVAYHASLNLIRDAPWFGWGAGSFQLVFPFYSAPFGTSLGGRWTHLHQDYLQTVIEWGVIGAVLWGVLVGGGWLRGARFQWRRPEELSNAAAVLAIAIYGVHAMIDFPMQIGSLRYYAAIYLAILWRQRHSRSDEGDGKAKKSRRITKIRRRRRSSNDGLGQAERVDGAGGTEGEGSASAG